MDGILGLGPILDQVSLVSNLKKKGLIEQTIMGFSLGFKDPIAKTE